MPSPPSKPPKPASAAPKPASSPAPAKPAVVPTASTATARGTGNVGLGVAIAAGGSGGTFTARQAGTLRDLAMDVDAKNIGVKAALQHMAKAINIAFQTDYGENELESVYQAAIVRNGELRIVHREYFGFRDTWFSQFGKLLRSMQLTLQGPDPASPEGQRRIAEKGAASIRGLLNLVGRKLDLVAEYEDRLPAYVEQMFDRLEASGIIVGWSRDDWEIRTTSIGLDIAVRPRAVGTAK